MEIQLENDICILTPLTPILDLREWKRLLEELVTYQNFKIGFDFSFVQDCTFEFIDQLYQLSQIYKVSFFNISSDVFAIFNFMNIDKNVDLFTSKLDFINNSHRLINRRFKTV